MVFMAQLWLTVRVAHVSSHAKNAYFDTENVQNCLHRLYFMQPEIAEHQLYHLHVVNIYPLCLARQTRDSVCFLEKKKSNQVDFVS